MDTFFSVVSGMPWPQVKEGDLREIRDRYEQLAKDLPHLRDLIATVAVKARQQFEGQAAEAFSSMMNDFIGESGGSDYVGAAAKTARALADCAGDVANSVEYTKWMAIAQLVQLMFETSMAVLWGPFSFGFELEYLALRYWFTRQVLWLLVKYLIKSILTHTFSGIVTGLLMDAIIQGIQFSHGDRHVWDVDSTKQSVLFGALGGVVAGPLNLLGMGLGRLLGSLVGKSGASVLAHELATVMKGGEKEALKGALEAATKKAVASAGGHAGAGAVGHAGAGAVGKGAGRAGAEAGGRWLSKDASLAFARDLGRVMDSTKGWLAEGFGKGGAGSVAHEFVGHVAAAFEKHLGMELGEKAARTLGREYGEAFVAGWAKGGFGHEALSASLRGVLERGEHGLAERGVSALADHLPGLAAHLPEGNKLFRLGFAVGEQLTEGMQGNLSEGFSIWRSRIRTSSRRRRRRSVRVSRWDCWVVGCTMPLRRRGSGTGGANSSGRGSSKRCGTGAAGSSRPTTR
ncbi:hypothetical protein AB0K43_24130 [Kitasatospora sp. NPDC049258]|uniref:WXG100-like domain-containing protein n=1 Tax=Kitasatospora sp. NPDC049258 TaxID=3155394 RepID=UPI00343AF443